LRRIAPPDDAEIVTDADGSILGWIRLRPEPAPGQPIVPGWDCYKAGGSDTCIPWRNYPTKTDAITALKHARYRPAPRHDLDWRVGDK
jgi:hypothetical protein